MKIYVMPNGRKYQFDEKTAPACAVPAVKEKAIEPKNKTRKVANKAKKVTNK